MEKLIHFNLEKGISSFDHADIYGDYTTENEFGKAFKNSSVKREDIQLISKCGIQYVGKTRPSNLVKHYQYDSDYIIYSAEKSIKDLNYSEAALLAALPKAPSKYNPYKYPEVAKFRRNLVLENLEENKFITKKELIRFKDSKLKLKRRKIEIVNEANSYTEEVRRKVKDIY